MAALEMDVWKGDWGLPSIDLNCLHAMAYAKFSGAPLKLNKTNNPWRSSTGELPIYRQRPSGITLTKFDTISRHLEDQGYNADYDLDERQKSDTKAYSQWLQDKLLPGLLYTWWVDSENYIDLSRPWFAGALPFPLNYFIPGQRHRAAKNYLRSKYCLDEEQDLFLENLILKNSQECLNLLAERLDKNEFFFGKSPTSMDALIFAYLAPLLKVPFPNPTLQNHLKNCANLVSFVVRILQRYFPTTTSSTLTNGTKSESQTPKNMTPNTVDELPNKYRNQFLAGLAAAAAMIGYALSTGLVQLDISDDMENDDHYGNEEEYQSFCDQEDDDD